MRPWTWVALGVALDAALLALLAFVMRDPARVVAIALAAIAAAAILAYFVDGRRGVAGIMVGILVLGPVVGYFALWILALLLR